MGRHGVVISHAHVSIRSLAASLGAVYGLRVCLHSSGVENAGVPMDGKVSRAAELMLDTGASCQTPPAPMSVDSEVGEMTTL